MARNFLNGRLDDMDMDKVSVDDSLKDSCVVPGLV